MTIEQLGPYWDDSFRKKPLDAERLLRLLGATGKLVGFRYTIYMLECIVADPKAVFCSSPRACIRIRPASFILLRFLWSGRCTH